MGIQATVLHKPGAVRLDGFPKLVYCPKIGEGIRLAADNSITVAAIVAEHRGGKSPEQIATSHGLTVDVDGEPAPNTAAIEEAIEYARKVGAFEAE